MVLERYNACQTVCFCGVFPEINRAWASVDNSFFIWRFDRWYCVKTIRASNRASQQTAPAGGVCCMLCFSWPGSSGSQKNGMQHSAHFQLGCRNDVPMEYSGEEQAICAVGLIRPRAGVFVDAIQYVLVLCTTVEVCRQRTRTMTAPHCCGNVLYAACRAPDLSAVARRCLSWQPAQCLAWLQFIHRMLRAFGTPAVLLLACSGHDDCA